MWQNYDCLSNRLGAAKTRADFDALLKDCTEAYTALSAEQSLEKAKFLGLIQSVVASLMELLVPEEPYGWEDK